MKQYLDDTSTTLLTNSMQMFLDHLNSVEPSIRFTVEMESEGKLPFLDVPLQHDPDKLQKLFLSNTSHVELLQCMLLKNDFCSLFRT